MSQDAITQGCMEEEGAFKVPLYWGITPALGPDGEDHNGGLGLGVYATTMYEMQMFESADATGPDLTDGKTITWTATPNPSFPITNFIDNNNSTRFSTLGTTDSPFIILVATGPVEVHSLTLLPFGGYHAKYYDLISSVDGVSFTRVTKFATASAGTLQTFTNL